MFWHTHSRRVQMVLVHRVRAISSLLLQQQPISIPLYSTPGIFDIVISALDAVAAINEEMLIFSFEIERPSIARAA